MIDQLVIKARDLNKSNSKIEMALCEIRNRPDSVFTVNISSPKGRSINSYWEGGSKTTYHLIKTNGVIQPISSGHPRFDACGFVEMGELGKGEAFLEITSTSKMQFYYLYIDPKDVELFPSIAEAIKKAEELQSTELSEEEKIVLYAICCLNSRGRKDLYERKRIDPTAAKEKLLSMKLITKRGSIEADGRNLCDSLKLRHNRYY